MENHCSGMIMVSDPTEIRLTVIRATFGLERFLACHMCKRVGCMVLGSIHANGYVERSRI